MKTFFIYSVVGICLFAGLTGLLVRADTFESLYRLSREHEDWELDEIIIAVFSAIIVILVALSIFTSRNLRDLRSEILLRERFQREAAATRHLQALGTLAGGLAHSANNHLQPIITLTRLSRDEVAGNSEVQGYMDRILSSAHNAAELFRNVLAFSHPNTATESIADIEQSLRQIEPLLNLSLGQGIKLEFEIEATGSVPLDSTSFTDAMLAMVANAGQAIPNRDGLVKVAIFRAKENDLGLRVEDNGDGMTADEISRAFDPFFTTKGVNEGNGLGLSIVRSLIERAGGSIAIESTKGQGTRLEIVFPNAARA